MRVLFHMFPRISLSWMELISEHDIQGGGGWNIPICYDMFSSSFQIFFRLISFTLVLIAIRFHDILEWDLHLT